MTRDWRAYLEDFHACRAGRVEEALDRCTADGMTPYTWLIRPVAGRARRVLDLACGSGGAAAGLHGDEAGAADRAGLAEQTSPLGQADHAVGTGGDGEPGDRGSVVVGVDRSGAELAMARSRHGLPVVRADACALPFPPASFDAVICSMGLMVVQPLDEVLHECARVLRTGGLLAATVASAVPLHGSDLRVLGPLTARLRSTPQFPGGAGLAGAGEAMSRAGLDVVDDSRERFVFRVRDERDARLLIESLYLPDTPSGRKESAIAWLSARAAATGVEVAAPIRRVLAMLR